MRVASVRGRLSLLTPDGAVDVERASGGRFAADPAAAYDAWDDLRDWAGSADLGDVEHYELGDLGAPSPRPRQAFGIGANYADHIAEAGIPAPAKPTIFAKFPTCIAGPTEDILLPSERVDWEVELVVVIGRRAHQVSEDRALDHVAGFTVGQDISERRVQFQNPIIQLALGKSFPTFGPIGPALVTLDELPHPADLAITCHLNGEQVQASRTSHLIFDVPTLVSYLSRHLVLLPGDLIFTGTPAGVGSTRDPRVWLQPGDELISEIEGIGRMQQRCAPAPALPH